jgi:hypothetical protein
MATDQENGRFQNVLGENGVLGGIVKITASETYDVSLVIIKSLRLNSLSHRMLQL